MAAATTVLALNSCDGGTPKKPKFTGRDFKKDPDGINYLKQIRKDFIKRTKKKQVYKTQLNN